MDVLILKFVECCRASGLRVSTSEVLDCLDQLKLIDLLDEPQFQAVLRANFAKSKRERDKFDRLYQLFFHELRTGMDISQAAPVAELTAEVLQRLKAAANGDLAYRAVLEFLSGNPLALLEELRNIMSEGNMPAQGGGFYLAPLARRLMILNHLNNIRRALEEFLRDNRSQLDWETRQGLMAYFNERLESASRLTMDNPRTATAENRQVHSYEQHIKQLGERSFFSLTPKEIEEMREIIEQLVRKLKDILGLRYARNDRGLLDVKKTLRAAQKYQGTPVEIIYRNRPPKKGKIVTLCDVSNSVWSAARFMLNMLYSLQECFTKVRSFVFVAHLAEVTQTFEDYEINQAIEEVLKEADIEYHAATDYGAVFRRFKRDYLDDILNKRTTLIIIGDGRTNYLNPEAEILEQMREKCRRVIWLNPEPERFWNSGDSEMYLYSQSCHEVRPCRNLNQLLEFIKSLVL